MPLIFTVFAKKRESADQLTWQVYVTKALEKAVDNSSTCFLPRGGTVETEQGRKEVAYNVESEQLATIKSGCLVLLYPSLPVNHSIF